MLLIAILMFAAITHGLGQVSKDPAGSAPSDQPSVSCMGIGFGFGNHFSIGMSYDILGKLEKSKSAHMGARLAYKGYLFRSLNMPADYEPGLFGGMPRDGISMLAVLIAVEARVNEDSDFGFLLGPAFNSIREISFTPDRNRIWGESNYDKDHERIAELGVMMEVKIKFRASDRYGLEVSGYLNANLYNSIVGLSLGFVFGNI